MESESIDQNLILKYNTDPYRGAIFIDDQYPQSIEEFEQMLKYTLELLKSVISLIKKLLTFK